MPHSPPPSEHESASGMNGNLGANRDNSRKAIIACDRCRVKKIKCNGAYPCRSCVTNSIECIYSRTARRYRGTTKSKTLELKRRLDDAERLLRTAGLIDQNNAGISSAPGQQDIQQDGTQLAIDCPHVELTPIGTHSYNSTLGSEGQLVPNFLFYSPATNENLTRGRNRNPGSSSITRITPALSECQGRESSGPSGPDEHITFTGIRSNPAPRLSSNPIVTDGAPPSRDELHGPHSFLSICADPGVDWIASRIGSSTFATCATSFVTTLSKKLKLRGRLKQNRTPEPPCDVACLYTKAFFDESHEATYHTIDQANFELRLRDFHNSSLPANDPAWYALRNAVYAVGCRIVTFKSNTWTEAQTQSQKYFENALAVEADLLHGSPGLVAVQALLIMALFAEGAGSAKLEYMLIGCATRLAHARGLHLNPSSPNIAFQDAQRRSWLFWTIYCFEKHLTQRSGRPSTIDDDDISCELPTWTPDANANLVEWFTQTVKQAMLTSAITKSFNTVKARQRTLLEKVDLVKQFDDRLDSWYKGLPASFQAGFAAKDRRLPDGVRLEHVLYLYLSFQGNLTAVHSVLGHPWHLGQDRLTGYSHQVAASDKLLQEASRNIVLATRSTQIDASAPVWLVFYYPLLGMINLFISIIKEPTAISTPSIMGVIDMAAGYFAYLDHSTDSVFSFSFVRNLAHWARQAVVEAPARVNSGSGADRPYTDLDVLLPIQEVFAASLSNMSGCDLDGMDLNDWPTFVPYPSQNTTW